MLHILFGLDDFSLHESLEEIKREIGDELLLASNTTVLDAEQLTASKLSEICLALPFLAPKRLVIVEGLLERFETRSGQKQQKKKNKENRQNYNEEFVALVGKLPETTVLILVDSSTHLLRLLLVQLKV